MKLGKLEMLRNKADGMLIAALTSLPLVSQVFAAPDLFETAGSGFTTVYEKIRSISTPVCVCVAVIAIIIALVGGEKAMEKGRKTALTTGVVWLVINGMGMIVAFVQSLMPEDAAFTGAGICMNVGATIGKMIGM